MAPLSRAPRAAMLRLSSGLEAIDRVQDRPPYRRRLRAGKHAAFEVERRSADDHRFDRALRVLPDFLPGFGLREARGHPGLRQPERVGEPAQEGSRMLEWRPHPLG